MALAKNSSEEGRVCAPGVGRLDIEIKAIPGPATETGKWEEVGGGATNFKTRRALGFQDRELCPPGGLSEVDEQHARKEGAGRRQR